MNRKTSTIIISTVTVIGILYGLAEHTHSGRILSLYTFGGFKAPVGVKIGCAKETNLRVEEKFTLPLDFDNESKNALQEFWHFSYYRDCLFRAGYDFGGTRILPSTMVSLDESFSLYTNYFGGIKFIVPGSSMLANDNVTDPDTEDRRLTSLIRIGDTTLTVLIYRNYDDLETFQELQTGFPAFSTSTGAIIKQEIFENEAGVNLLFVQQDDGLHGFVTINEQGQVMQIFGHNLPSALLQKIRDSLSFFEPLK